jgi:hypothetical protein
MYSERFSPAGLISSASSRLSVAIPQQAGCRLVRQYYRLNAMDVEEVEQVLIPAKERGTAVGLVEEMSKKLPLLGDYRSG